MRSLIHRRAVLSAALLSALPLLLNSKETSGAARKQNLTADKGRVLPADSPVSARAVKTPRPLVHVTDLYRPHNDPDDHWDLATAYALAWRGDVNLLGILTDNPENIQEVRELQRVIDDFVDSHTHVTRSPDVAAVAQLNYLTDRAVPVTTGTIWPKKPGEKVREDNLPREMKGVNMLLTLLKESSQPVAITIGGSCLDVAVAGKREPNLFSEKCAAIYLNAGVGSQNPAEQMIDGQVEWNVSLNPGAYAAIFELPCPIYWLPCFNSFHGSEVTVGEYGAYWAFRQKEVLPYLSGHLQAFFAYVLGKESGTNWLSYLLDESSKDAAQKYLDEERGMYCTAAFLHAAGKTVTSDGEIVSLERAREQQIYELVPIEVRCDVDGITEWHKTGNPTSKYIFRVKDKGRYGNAMVKALKSMLRELP